MNQMVKNNNNKNNNNSIPWSLADDRRQKPLSLKKCLQERPNIAARLPLHQINIYLKAKKAGAKFDGF